MQEIITNAMQAVEAKRWVSADQAQPNTVELWVRIFEGHMQHSEQTPDYRATQHQILCPVHHAGVVSIDRELGLGRHHPPLEGLGGHGAGPYAGARQVHMEGALR